MISSERDPRSERPSGIPREYKPRIRLGDPARLRELSSLLKSANLHTVCEEAHCPNLGECWSQKTATFLIMGSVCTRGCRFCAVATGIPSALDPNEPEELARVTGRLGLRHVVVTSVTRDDLPDGGAEHFARTIRALHALSPRVTVETLISDLQGDWSALRLIIVARPEILNHNLETVERLTPSARAKARYRRSLDLLARAKEIDPEGLTKSGLMVGLGESEEELLTTFRELREARVDILTVGQYLQPGPKHISVERYYRPDEFERLREKALAMGFAQVESGALVRSSYHARLSYEGATRDSQGAPSSSSEAQSIARD